MIVLKGPRSFVVDPDGHVLVHTGCCVGLVTGGSGDVLAGIVGGLAARGAISATASAWGAWVHGRAGEMLTDQFGSVGFLARELLPLIPPLLDSFPDGCAASLLHCAAYPKLPLSPGLPHRLPSPT